MRTCSPSQLIHRAPLPKNLREDMFEMCVSQVQLCLLDSDCSRRCFWPHLSHSSVLNLTRAVFLSRCLSGNEGEAAMASRCQLAPCHMIVVKWQCNNCNNMFLAQFKPLLRCSFYLRGGGGRIYDCLHVSVCHSSWVSLSFQPCPWQTRCLWKGCS